MNRCEILTFGHGRAPATKLLAALDGLYLQRIVDCRAKPISFRNPAFSREALERGFGERYEFFGTTLGNPATFDMPAIPPEDHRRALEDIDARAAGSERLALMCSETDWRKCHRHDIALELSAMGADVVHLEPVDGDWGRGVRRFPISEKPGETVSSPVEQVTASAESRNGSPSANPNVEGKANGVSGRCVYAEKLLADLEAAERVKRVIWEENQVWSTAAKWLREAHDGEATPIVFRDAGQGGDITHAGVLARVDFLEGDRTHYTVVAVRRLPKPIPFGKLMLINARRPIAEDDIRSYRLVETPESVRALLSKDGM